VLFFTTLVNLFVLVVSWQRKKVRSGLYFSLGMLAITGWTIAATFDYAAVPIPLKVFFSKLEYVCYNSALVFMALFAFSFAGYSQWLESKRGVGLLGFIALSNILLAWTNDWHGWLWAGFSVSQFGDNTVIFEPGPAHIWTTVTGYFIILLIVIPLWQATLSGPALSRRQARWLLLGTLVPVAANLVYILQSHEYTGVDW
jgi:hypothetical protein